MFRVACNACSTYFHSLQAQVAVYVSCMLCVVLFVIAWLLTCHAVCCIPRTKTCFSTNFWLEIVCTLLAALLYVFAKSTIVYIPSAIFAWIRTTILLQGLMWLKFLQCVCLWLILTVYATVWLLYIK